MRFGPLLCDCLRPRQKMPCSAGVHANRRHYLEVGHADSISVRCALNDDVRIHLFVFRDAQAPRFSASDSSLLGFAMRGLRWFYRQQLLSHGLLIANAPLTPAVRQVLSELQS